MARHGNAPGAACPAGRERHAELPPIVARALESRDAWLSASLNLIWILFVDLRRRGDGLTSGQVVEKLGLSEEDVNVLAWDLVLNGFAALNRPRTRLFLVPVRRFDRKIH
jgi:hypothetical protein